MSRTTMRGAQRRPGTFRSRAFGVFKPRRAGNGVGTKSPTRISSRMYPFSRRHSRHDIRRRKPLSSPPRRFGVNTPYGPKGRQNHPGTIRPIPEAARMAPGTWRANEGAFWRVYGPSGAAALPPFRLRHQSRRSFGRGRNQPTMKTRMPAPIQSASRVAEASGMPAVWTGAST